MTSDIVYQGFKKCKEINCDSKHFAKGYCRYHYNKNTRSIKSKKVNDVIIIDNICEIVLRDKNNQITNKAIIDIEDYHIIKDYRWILRKKPYMNTGYAISGRGGKFIMHRLLHPEWKMIDHINRNGLDNRRSNLRECNYIQNAANAGPSKNKKDGIKGVYYYPKNRYRKWGTEIIHNKIRYRLGYFKTQKEAIMAYNNKSIELNKEFAFINTI